MSIMEQTKNGSREKWLAEKGGSPEKVALRPWRPRVYFIPDVGGQVFWRDEALRIIRSSCIRLLNPTLTVQLARIRQPFFQDTLA